MVQVLLSWFTSHDISLQQYRTVLHDLHQKAVNVFLHVSNLLSPTFHLCLQPDHHFDQVLQDDHVVMILYLVLTSLVCPPYLSMISPGILLTAWAGTGLVSLPSTTRVPTQYG